VKELTSGLNATEEPELAAWPVAIGWLVETEEFPMLKERLSG